MSAPDDFTVEASAGTNVRVSWTEDGAPFWFLADYAGDTLGEIKARAFGKGGGVICSRTPSRKSNSLMTYPATDPRFAEVIAFARREIEARGLISAAVSERQAVRERREAEEVRRKAQALREALLPVCVAAVEALARTPDADLAAAVDRIQNAAF